MYITQFISPPLYEEMYLDTLFFTILPPPADARPSTRRATPRDRVLASDAPSATDVLLQVSLMCAYRDPPFASLKSKLVVYSVCYTSLLYADELSIHRDLVISGQGSLSSRSQALSLVDL